MFTKLTIDNFKGLERAEVPLADAVVFIGPNNSGKTTALQALTLWDIGLHKWSEKRKESAARERTGVTINRRDLFSIPIPSARLLWHDLHVRNIERVDGKPKTSNVTFEITVDASDNSCSSGTTMSSQILLSRSKSLLRPVPRLLRN